MNVLREMAQRAIGNIAGGGAELARKLHDYPALMAQLEKVKELSGDVNKKGREAAIILIRHFSPKLSPADKELIESKKELRDT